MFDPLSLTTKVIIFVMFMCLLPAVKPVDPERHATCLSCLRAAQEIEKVMKEVSSESRHIVIDSLLTGGVCAKLSSHKEDRISKDKMASSCTHLFESHHNRFKEALANKEPEHLNIILCYEQSTACVGVKLQSFEYSKEKNVMESHIEDVLRDNKENVRIARPVHSGSPVNSRDEL